MNKNGIQDYAYVGNEIIHAKDYNNQVVKCRNGHDLIFVNAEKRRKHFRHKNKNDLNNEISDWHLDWQAKFERTEVNFKKVNGQIKDRRADAVQDNYIFEFQHSSIDLTEVNNRVHDYNLHNMKVIWIVDGSNIKIRNNRFIEFKDEWKYKSFIDQDIILIDIDNKLYKVYPKYVKSNMIDVEEAKDVTDITINVLRQCTLRIKQQGAGNGKTYGIINKLASDDFDDYKCFIIVTKQHSAKYIINDEFNKQMANLGFSNVQRDDTNKQYKLKYEKNNKIKTLIIGTIDSLFYNLGDKYHKSKSDLFERLVESIIDGYIESVGQFNYAKESLKLNKEVCLIIDETQDLPRDYGCAIYEIMRSKYVDAYVVGDLLQSITFDDNAFTYLQSKEFSYINKINYEPINICRRFNNKGITDFCNNFIDFDKYKLPQINVIDESNTNNLTFIKQDKNEPKNTIEGMMYHYNLEVENGRKSNDFLIVTPFTRNNELVTMLEVAITKYWVNKLGPEDKYNRYAIFHKSEDGSSIDLNESKDSTRIVSIHTSKGDGRSVVFVIGITESNLKKFSGMINLVYESLLHVSITRQKESLYFVYQDNNDNIHKRILNSCNDIDPFIDISRVLNFNKIIESVNELPINNLEFDDDNNEIIDMSHHIIRYACMSMSFLLKACNKGLKQDIKKQYYAILKNVIKLPIRIVESYKEYNGSLKRKDKDTKPIDASEICILKISNGRDYSKYFDAIYKAVCDVKNKVQQILNGSHIELKTYGLIVLFFLIETIEKGHHADISIKELYNITHILSNTDNKVDGVNKYLASHYTIMNFVNEQFDKFLKNDITWLYMHKIDLNKNSKDYLVYELIPFIGHDKDNVYLIYIKPQFNNLNYLKTIIKATFDTYLVKNIKEEIKQEETNYQRFNGKKVITIVFSTSREYYTTVCDLNVANIIKQKLIDHYLTKSKQIQQFYNYNYNKYKQLTNEEIIDNIITNYRTRKGDKVIYPSFVDKFFNLLEFEIEQDGNLVKYLDYDFTKIVTKSIELFLKT